MTDEKSEFNNQTLFASELLGARLEVEPPPTKRKYTITDHKKTLRDHQWKPGQSGNPKGRPVKNLSIVSLVKDRLEKHPEEAEEIALALIHLAKTKNLWAIESVMNRIDGKVEERHHIEGALPITIQFVPAEMLLGRKQDVIEGEFAEIKELEQGE